MTWLSSASGAWKWECRGWAHWLARSWWLAFAFLGVATAPAPCYQKYQYESLIQTCNQIPKPVFILAWIWRRAEKTRRRPKQVRRLRICRSLRGLAARSNLALLGLQPEMAMKWLLAGCDPDQPVWSVASSSCLFIAIQYFPVGSKCRSRNCPWGYSRISETLQTTALALKVTMTSSASRSSRPSFLTSHSLKCRYLPLFLVLLRKEYCIPEWAMAARLSFSQPFHPWSEFLTW